MKHDVCAWCLSPIKIPCNANPLQKFTCSPQCMWAEWMFMKWMSDEEINRRMHYAILTRGDDDG